MLSCKCVNYVEVFTITPLSVGISDQRKTISNISFVTGTTKKCNQHYKELGIGPHDWTF